jgi:hypothetical protein
MKIHGDAVYIPAPPKDLAFEVDADDRHFLLAGGRRVEVTRKRVAEIAHHHLRYCELVNEALTQTFT